MATMASGKGATRLHGRFDPGSNVRLVKVEGPHVLRPGPQHETVAAETVDSDGWVNFTGLDAGERYFAVGLAHGTPVEVRLTARADGSEDASLAEMYGDPGLLQRTRLSDGTFVDEPPDQHQEPDLPGATWPGQHQVPEGVFQRSDTPRGTAHPISAEELERTRLGHRKQEPTDPVVEDDNTVAPDERPARTSKPAAKTPAKTTKKGA